MLTAPTRASARYSSARLGATAAPAMTTPNAIEVLIIARVPVRPRAATQRPPMTAPTPIDAVMKP